MNSIDFNQVGGFPMTTNILAKLQTAFSVFNALGNIVGDLTIISGCEVVGTNVTDGVVFVAGEIFEFKGGSIQSKVKIVEVVESLVFQNGNSNPVIKSRYVTFGTGVGAMDWVDFKRGLETKNLQTTFEGIATSLETIIDKLDTIDRDAKVQVPTDWDATTGVQQLLNKPDISSPFLLKGVFPIGDIVGTDNIRTITFPTVGTAAYMVLGSIKSKSADYNTDNDAFVQWREPTTISFKLCLREVSPAVQDLEFHYVLIAL